MVENMVAFLCCLCDTRWLGPFLCYSAVVTLTLYFKYVPCFYSAAVAATKRINAFKLRYPNRRLFIMLISSLNPLNGSSR